MALMAESGRSMLSSSDPAPKLAPTDHLADIRSVLQGEPRVRTQVVLARLAQHNPAEYEGWTFQRLTEVLAEAGLSARKSGGVMVVRAADVALALADRADDTTDATDGGVDDEG
jgi:DNA segregation ATPase FtsK/SpoIIIE, S-DNA-T family